MALQGLPQKNLNQLILFVKSGTLQNACSTKPRAVVGFGEKCSFPHRQVDEQPTKRSKKNDDKSAVAMLKKNDLHEKVWQLVVNRDKVTIDQRDPISSVILVIR